MKPIVGVFKSRSKAEQAVQQLRTIGLERERIDLLSPDAERRKVEAVRTTDTEEPGIGRALGGVVGVSVGGAVGAELGAAAASLFFPGVGPVLATGIIGAALLGLGGAVGGAKLGKTLDESMTEGLPIDELYVYKDALRKGRCVLIALAKDDAQAESTRVAMKDAGADSIDSAREDWWLGIRRDEEEHYKSQGGDFRSDEAIYRCGFEAAQRPAVRGRTYKEALDDLRVRNSEVCEEPSFKRGYERGQSYRQSIDEESRK